MHLCCTRATKHLHKDVGPYRPHLPPRRAHLRQRRPRRQSGVPQARRPLRPRHGPVPRPHEQRAVPVLRRARDRPGPEQARLLHVPRPRLLALVHIRDHLCSVHRNSPFAHHGLDVLTYLNLRQQAHDVAASFSYENPNPKPVQQQIHTQRYKAPSRCVAP
jgi:hypothetical protein